MRVRRVLPIVLSVSFYAGNNLVAIAQTEAMPVRQAPGSITLNATNAIHSMDANDTIYSSIQISNGNISTLSNQPSTNATITLPKGAAVYPGFIDSHSHAVSLSLAKATDANKNPYWISLANVNVMLLPKCPASGLGSVTCFNPVTSQNQVISLLSNAKPNAAGWILGWNYEPSRMSCEVRGSLTFGPKCPNFEDQSKATALQQLDKLQPNYPLMVTSESGHIVYVNTKALLALNICHSTAGMNCYMPTINTEQEIQLANTGQLDEDAALYAIGRIDSILADNYAGFPNVSKEKVLEFYGSQVKGALDQYSQLGYTTVQEGAAGASLIAIYMSTASALASQKQYLPVTMAFLEFDDKTAQDFPSTGQMATTLQHLMTSAQYDMFIAGLKVYSDGSNQGFTGYMDSPGATYVNQSAPFTNPAIFSQPYNGLPDFNGPQVADALSVAHKSGFPLWIHTNGNRAQTEVLGALATEPDTRYRDVILHFSMPTKQQVQSVPANRIGVTFLVNDFYYYYQTMCEQILEPGATTDLYPAQWAKENKLHYGLHSDTTVTPPSPLFSVWVATTREYQKTSWLPPLASTCQASQKRSQVISRMDALRAYTSDAAWLYSRETTVGKQPGIGSLQQGFAGDLVVFSADPLLPDTDLSKVYVMYTIHNGNIVYPASGNGPATTPPIWPN
jgi:predicted amidohydrolase YtcJ